MANELEESADWGRVFSEAVAIVRPLTGSDAEAAMEEAMMLLFAGKSPPRQAGEAVAAHLARAGLHAWRVRQRMDRKHRHPRGLSKLLRLRNGTSYAPEDPAARLLDEQHKGRLFEDLLLALESDPEARDIVTRVRQGMTGAAEQADALGVSVAIVLEARKRIKVRMDALAAHGRGEVAAITIEQSVARASP